MKTRYLVTILSWSAIILSLAFSGCTALQTFPQAARAGDTVALGAGSADGMSRANTTAYFVSDSGSTQYDLTPGIRGIFRLYADKASNMYSAGSTTNYITSTSGHEPWLSVVVIDLPPGLPTGTGKVHVTTTATYPTIGSHINDLPINLEIIPGTGAPSSLSYEFGHGSGMPGDPTQLESLPLAQVMPVFPSSTSWPAYGAVEIKMHVPTTAGTSLTPAQLRVLVDDMSVSTSSNLHAIYHDDSNQDLTVMLLSPIGRLRYFEPRFSIVPLYDQFVGTPTITSVRFFDINGNQVAGPTVSDFVVQLR
jgi:hypothetical protein